MGDGRGRGDLHLGEEGRPCRIAVESAAAVAGKGLEGNRYFDTGRPEQELTLIEAEQLEYALAEHGLEIDAAATRPQHRHARAST